MNLGIGGIKVLERIRKEVSGIDELAEDIRQNGLLQAIVVMELGGGEFQLLAGLRRLKAAQQLGWETIDVNVVAPADAEAALRIEISENVQREPFTYSEQMYYAELLANIEHEKASARKREGNSLGGTLAGKGRPLGDRLADHGPPTYEQNSIEKAESRDKIGARIGMSGRQYSRAKYISNNAPQEIIDELDRGERSIRTTYDELRSKEKDARSDNPTTDTCEADAPTQAKKPKSAPPKSPKMLALEKSEEERIRKVKEWDAMKPAEKVPILEERANAEYVRANNAEAELRRYKETKGNQMYHMELSLASQRKQIDELTEALTKAHARIKELETKYERS